MKRVCLAIGSLALVALLGVTMVGRPTVDAQDSATPGASGTPAAGSSSGSTRESAKDTYLATLAEKLGVTTEQLQTAIDETNQELGSGAWFGGMGGSHESHRGEFGRGNGFGRGGNNGNGMGSSTNAPKGGSLLRGVDLADAAAFLGITEDELTTELQTSTFLQIATDHGKTTDDVRAFLIQQATDTIDERLQAAENASASDEAATPATGGSTTSGATEVPAAPAETPTATA